MGSSGGESGHRTEESDMGRRLREGGREEIGEEAVGPGSTGKLGVRVSEGDYILQSNGWKSLKSSNGYKLSGHIVPAQNWCRARASTTGRTYVPGMALPRGRARHGHGGSGAGLPWAMLLRAVPGAAHSARARWPNIN